jgi:hypothetical protein
MLKSHYHRLHSNLDSTIKQNSLFDADFNSAHAYSLLQLITLVEISTFSFFKFHVFNVTLMEEEINEFTKRDLIFIFFHVLTCRDHQVLHFHTEVQ